MLYLRTNQSIPFSHSFAILIIPVILIFVLLFDDVIRPQVSIFKSSYLFLQSIERTLQILEFGLIEAGNLMPFPIERITKLLRCCPFIARLDIVNG